MSLTKAQREALQAYSEKKDRGREPVFVGREDLFDLAAGNARAASRGDAEGRTVCIAGPPGIGKTAFLREMRERTAAGEWGAPPTACIEVGPGELHSPIHVLAQIASQLPKEWRPSLDAVKKALGRLGGASVSLGGAGFEFSLSASFRQDNPKAGMMPWTELFSVARGMPPDAVLCLVVDEAHSLDPTPGQERNRLLQSLHMGPPSIPDGAPLPIFAVLAGHTHTPEVLEASVSKRFADGNLQYMKNLWETESLAYVERTLAHLGVPRAEPGRRALAHWVVGECGGFPHHLRNAMESVAEGLLRSDGLALSGLDGAFVSARLRERRARYYGARTNGAIAQASRQLGVLLRGWSRRARPVSEAGARRELSALLDGLPEEVRREIEDEGIAKGRDLMAEMVRKGALMTDMEGGGCRCSIVSLIGWLETGGHAARSRFPNLPAG